MSDMFVRKTLVALLGASLLLCWEPRLFASEDPERQPREEEDAAARPTREEASALLKRRIAGEPVKSLGPISLGGFNYSRTLEIGSGRSLIAVSCNLGGGLLAFDPSGDLVAARRTWEQVSLQLVDFDRDGQDEVITVEKDTVGTGFIGWTYHVYRLASDRWEHLWSGTSYESIKVGSQSKVREGTLRVAEPGTDRPYLVYVERSGDSKNWSVSEWHLDGSKLKRR